MSLDLPNLGILVIIFAGAFVHAASGFGSALVMMPLLALLIDLKVATPVVALVAVTVQLGILLKHWREVQVASAWRLIVSSVVGIPLGVYCLRGTYEHPLKLILALVIIGFSSFVLLKPTYIRLETERTSFFFGFMAGVLGGAYNTNGPPIVIYSVLRRWEPEAFRATLQGYFFPTAMVVLFTHWQLGLWTTQVFDIMALALPVVLAAILIGGMVSRRIPPGRFDRLIHILLMILGVVLLGRTVQEMLA